MRNKIVWLCSILMIVLVAMIPIAFINPTTNPYLEEVEVSSEEVVEQSTKNNEVEVVQNDYEWNDTQHATLYLNLFIEENESNPSKQQIAWNVAIPENIIEIKEVYDWELILKHGRAKYHAQNFHCRNMAPVPHDSWPIDEETETQIFRKNDDTNTHVEIEELESDDLCWASSSPNYVDETVKVENLSGDKGELDVVFSISNYLDEDDNETDLYFTSLGVIDFAFFQYGTNNDFKLVGDFLFQNINLSTVTFDTDPASLEQIENDFEIISNSFLPPQTTYSDIESILKSCINNVFAIDWNKVDLIFYDENYNVLDKNSVIQNPTLNIKLKGKDQQPVYPDGANQQWFGETDIFQITVPYVEFNMYSATPTNIFGYETYESIWSNANGWNKKGDELDTIYRSNSDMYFTVNDPNVSYVSINTPDSTEDIIVSNGETILLDYNLEQNYVQDYETKITFYLNDGNTLDFTYNVKQRGTSVNVLNDGVPVPSFVTTNEETGLPIDSYLIDYFPWISYDVDSIKEVNIKTPTGEVIESISSDFKLDSSMGYGLYVIETIDYFGNVKYEYLEIYEEDPVYLTTRFEDSELGKEIYQDASSLGYTPNELNDMNSEDMIKLYKDMNELYDLSSFELSEVELLDSLEYLEEGNNYLVSDIQEQVENNIYSQIDEQKNDDSWSASDQVNVIICDKYKNELSQEDTLPKEIIIKLEPINTNIHEDGYERIFDSKVKGYYYSTPIQLFSFDSYSLSTFDLDEQAIYDIVGYFDVSNKTFSDLKHILNKEVINQINSQSNSYKSYNESDFAIAWYGQFDGSPKYIELNDTSNLSDLTSNELYLKIKPNNDKSMGEFEGEISINFYQSTDLSTSTLTNVNNELIPIYFGTEFYQVKDWLDDEILWLLNEDLYNYEYFKDPIEMDDISITYSIDDDYEFLNDVETFNFTVVGLTPEWTGKKTGTVEFQIQDKIENISSYQFDSEMFLARNEESLNQVNKTTTLDEIKPTLEEEIANQLNIENNSISSYATSDVSDQGEIIVDDLIFNYSIDSNESVWTPFEVSVTYRYSPEEQPLNIVIDLQTDSSQMWTTINYSLLIAVVSIVTLTVGYVWYRKIFVE